MQHCFIDNTVEELLLWGQIKEFYATTQGYDSADIYFTVKLKIVDMCYPYLLCGADQH